MGAKTYCAIHDAFSRFKHEVQESARDIDLSAYRDNIKGVSNACRLSLLCESPIEVLVYWEFLVSAMSNPELSDEKICCVSWNNKAADNLVYDVYPQKTVVLGRRTFRCDFLVEILNDKEIVGKICIELDGHDFHERTKDQAQRDKLRDREFQKAGYTVLRYTGSEVFKDPSIVISDIENIVEDLSLKTFGSTNGEATA